MKRALKMSCLLLFERRKGIGEERDNTMFNLLTDDKQMWFRHRKKQGVSVSVSDLLPFVPMVTLENKGCGLSWLKKELIQNMWGQHRATPALGHR